MGLGIASMHYTGMLRCDWRQPLSMIHTWLRSLCDYNWCLPHIPVSSVPASGSNHYSQERAQTAVHSLGNAILDALYRDGSGQL